MKHSWEHGITVILLNREIIRHCILCRDAAAAFYQTTLKKQSFRESGLAWSVIAKERNVLDFVRIIYFHDAIDYKWLVNLGF